MHVREATKADIPQMHTIRMAVKENILSDPALVSEQDYENFLTLNGKGWVCETNGKITGFAIVDLLQRNVWALFVSPEYENKGIGRKLHDTMLDWYFDHNSQPLYLSTDPNTKAEKFYRKAGWRETGTEPNNEIAFEINIKDWQTSY
jgi:GNAT superfamily N-acetyltransferase